jgi:hypothetical protein
MTIEAWQSGKRSKPPVHVSWYVVVVDDPVQTKVESPENVCPTQSVSRTLEADLNTPVQSYMESEIDQTPAHSAGIELPTISGVGIPCIWAAVGRAAAD